MNQSKRYTVYVVTLWNNGEEPVVTVFSDEDAARAYMAFCKNNYDGACVDECPVYSKFIVSNAEDCE